jgi:hypothetical protein
VAIRVVRKTDGVDCGEGSGRSGEGGVKERKERKGKNGKDDE